MMIAGHLVDPANIPVSWSDIAGLEEVIQELRETVILPIQKKELFADSQLTQPPKGITYKEIVILILERDVQEGVYMKIIVQENWLFLNDLHFSITRFYY